MQQLLGPLLSHLSPAHIAYVTGRVFFPNLITGPFHDGLGVAFGFAIVASVIAAVASALTGKIKAPTEAAASRGVCRAAGAELAAVAGEGGFEPSELVVPTTWLRTPQRRRKARHIGIIFRRGTSGAAHARCWMRVLWNPVVSSFRADPLVMAVLAIGSAPDGLTAGAASLGR